MSEFTAPLFEASDMAACFNKQAEIGAMLEFEAALALAQAECAIINPAHAALIAEVAASITIDHEQIARTTLNTGSPAIDLVKQLRQAVARQSPAAAADVHFGATSQDVIDTALMLNARRALLLLHNKLRQLAQSLAALASEHRHSHMLARTLSQHAGVTSFGLKAANWLAAVKASSNTLVRLEAELPLQLGGAVGTRAAYGDAETLVPCLAQKLQLRPALPWHTERGFVRELGAALANCGAACGKIAVDLRELVQSDVAELVEGGGGGSSAMPHKQNPIGTLAANAAVAPIAGLLATLFANHDHQHERACGAWHSELRTLIQLFVALGGAVHGLNRVFDHLEVRSTTMRQHLEDNRGLVYAEAARYLLLTQLDRDTADAAISAAIADVVANGASLPAALAEQRDVAQHFDHETLQTTLSPEHLLGDADTLIDRILGEARETGLTD